jgi:PKD repeat protein
MRIVKSVCALIFLCVGFSVAQNMDYASMMEDPNSSFSDIQSAFNANWNGKDRTVKGKGWKAFKRWEYFHRNRLAPNGKAANPYANFVEYKNYFGNSQQFSSQKLITGQQALVAGTWSYIGPPGGISNNGGAGRTTFIRFDPTNPNIMYAGSPAGGLWKSMTGGNNWIALADEIASIGCSDLVIDPTNTNVLYLATGDADAKDTYSIGVLKSTDGGLTWNTTGLSYLVSANSTISKLLINPNNNLEIWAAASSGLMKTTDGGVNWVMAKTGGFKDIEFKPGNPNTVYATGGTAFYVTRNSGASWTLVPLGLTGAVGRTSMAVTPADSNYVYILAGLPGTGSADDYGFMGICRSTDGAQTFTVVNDASSENIMGWSTSGSDQGGQAWYDIAIACSPVNKNHIVTGGVNVWQSTNGGINMDCLSDWGGWSLPYVHADVHAIEFVPGSSTFYVGCDGGVYQTVNSGSSWIDVSDGLQIAQQYNLGVSQTNPAITLTGWQDNGTNLHNATNCSEVMGGDGFECIVSWSSASVMYGELYYGDINKSTNGGASFSGMVNSGGSGVDEDGDWNTPYIQHPTNASTLLVGKSEVYRSTNAGSTWSTVGSIGTSSSLKKLAYAPSNPNYIYATNGGSLWVSTNGTSFTLRPSPPVYITSMAVDPANPDIMWITSSGYTSGNKVYVTTNAGVSWQNYSTGLPNVPCNAIVYQSGTNDALYVGTDIGVFYRDSSMSSWIGYSNGFPNVVVAELEIQVSAGKLRAATYGRGLWETDLYAAPSAPPVAAFTSNKISACKTNPIDFYDNSTNLPYSWNWTFTGGNPATSTVQYPSVTWANTGVYDVKLVVTNQAGTDSSVMTGYITIYPNPIAVAGNDTTMCKGDTIQLNASGGQTYSWNQQTYLSNPFTPNPLSFPNASKTFAVTVSDSNGCKSTDYIVVYVIQPPANPTISVSGSQLLAYPASANFSYQWFYNGLAIAGANSTTLIADSSGNYSVQISDTSGCFSLSSATLAFVGINEINLLSGWNFYPNPARDVLNISAANNFSGALHVKIYSADGRLVKAEQFIVKNGENVQLKTNFAPGIYLLDLRDSEGKFYGMQRFLVVRSQ